MTPSLTDQCSFAASVRFFRSSATVSGGYCARSFMVTCPSQPSRSLPLKIAVKPGGGFGASAGTGAAGAVTATAATSAAAASVTEVRIGETPGEALRREREPAQAYR